ncbi:MAG: nicotinate (nicotinamide) nucleotide adenylyltransferase [Caldithrix sp.]|nr:MAG: nicotinate (nicotinamide) nucleotide adenylyltransferase [Caldithrix sp.]
MKIGLYGGTFDPIHTAHLLIAQYITEELNLQKIIFIPSADPPHKAVYSSSEHRFKMLQLAILKNAAFEISAFEIKKKGVSFSVDTIEQLKKQLNVDKQNLFWIIGSDNFVDFPNWKDPDKIFELCNVVVFPRNTDDFEKAPNEYQERAFYLKNTPLLDISSTRIRTLVKEKRSIKYWVPPAVEAFIHSEKLYA